MYETLQEPAPARPSGRTLKLLEALVLLKQTVFAPLRAFIFKGSPCGDTLLEIFFWSVLVSAPNVSAEKISLMTLAKDAQMHLSVNH